jgi:hypothetical protein
MQIKSISPTVLPTKERTLYGEEAKGERRASICKQLFSYLQMREKNLSTKLKKKVN